MWHLLHLLYSFTRVNIIKQQLLAGLRLVFVWRGLRWGERRDTSTVPSTSSELRTVRQPFLSWSLTPRYECVCTCGASVQGCVRGCVPVFIVNGLPYEHPTSLWIEKYTGLTLKQPPTEGASVSQIVDAKSLFFCSKIIWAAYHKMVRLIPYPSKFYLLVYSLPSQTEQERAGLALARHCLWLDRWASYKSILSSSFDQLA